MNKPYPFSAIVLVLSLVLSSAFSISNALADPASPPLEEVVTIGSRDAAEAITGSAHYISEEALDKFEYSDIQRISREVPGVSIQIEDGYGLRPNISIRGVATERSGRITLLEDNVLVAPAPYSAPSAYYFPTSGRMQAFEVVKGPSAITQGPYTIGGALNMVSTAIPQEQRGKVLVELGEDSTARVHANYGGTLDSGFGYLLEVHQWQSDGFQTIDRTSKDTGLDVTDYTLKLSYAPQGSAHSVELKLQKADQKSNQSYLGLTDVDFREDSYRRYGLSELDNIETAHEQAILRYRYQPSDNFRIAATVYNNTHERDWFKTEGIDLDGSSNAQSFSRTSWSNIVQAVNRGQSLSFGDLTFDAGQLNSILNGTLDTEAGSIQVRSNAREYYSRGIQFKLNWATEIAGANHQIEAGLRYHEDEEDRLQRNSTYQQVDGRLQLNDLGELGNAGNRIQEAQAVALYIQDNIELGDWVLTPGFRVEDIKQSRTRFRGGANRTFRDGRENDTNVVLPGFGAIYKISDQLSVVGGVHKGFTAPSNSPGVREEEAINTEFGVRFNDGHTRAELIAFSSDYENLLGECTSSSGSNCEIGDAFNGDAATVRGVEALVSSRVEIFDQVSLSAQLSFTYIDGEFDTDIADTAFFGDVNAGDPIPYIPETQFQFSLGLDKGAWQVNTNISYVDEVCARASCGVFERTDDALTLDIAGNYLLNDSLKIFARLENATDERDILGRQPYGARPNKGRSSSVGVEFNF
jgi:Fe(3+) dicitrate transport protein